MPPAFPSPLLRPSAITASLFDIPPIDLGGSKITAALQVSQAASALLQTYTNTVLETAIIELDPSLDGLSKSTVVQDLPQHQMTAQANALMYLNTINPLIVSTVADVIGFANLWNAQFSLLVKLANMIDEGNNKATFTVGINNLIKKARAARTCAEPVITALKDFLPLVIKDRSNLGDDFKSLKLALTGLGGELDELQMEIDGINQAISRDVAIIAGGAVADLVGVLVIGIGIVTLPESAGTILVVGLALIGTGSAAIGIAAKNLRKEQDKLRNVVATFNKDKSALTQTQQAKTTIDNLTTAVMSGTSAIQALQKGWNSLEDDFQLAVNQLQMATPSLGAFLVAQLNAANSDWQDTLKLAINLQMNGTLPVMMQPNMAFQETVAA